MIIALWRLDNIFLGIVSRRTLQKSLVVGTKHPNVQIIVPWDKPSMSEGPKRTPADEKPGEIMFLTILRKIGQRVSQLELKLAQIAVCNQECLQSRSRIIHLTEPPDGKGVGHTLFQRKAGMPP